MEAQLKLRYSQEGFKKAQRGPDWLNHCFGSSKALVPWLCHTLQVKHEAEGRLLRRGLPTGDVFCVQAAIALSRFPLAGAWWKEGREGGVCLEGSTLLLSAQVSGGPPGCSETSIARRNWGRKPMQRAVWKEGPTSLPCIGEGGAFSLSGLEGTFANQSGAWKPQKGDK